MCDDMVCTCLISPKQISLSLLRPIMHLYINKDEAGILGKRL